MPTLRVNAGVSAALLKSARDAGFKIKTVNDATRFCKTEAPLGSRFASESCYDEEQVKLYLSRAQEQRDKLGHMLGSPAGAR